MKTSRLAFAPFAAAVLLPLCAQAQVYTNETFNNGDVVGSVPSDPLQRTATNSTANGVTALVENSSTAFGGTTNQYVRFQDTSTTAGGGLEYSTEAGVGNLYARFQFLDANTTTAANTLFFGIGNASTVAGTIRLNSNANRSFGIEFSSNGTNGTILLRGGTTGGTGLVSGMYSLTTINTVQLYANDSEANSLTYTRPDGGGTALLAPNSAVVYLNGALIGAEPATGYALNQTAGGFGNAAGSDTSLGRFGFASTTATTPNMLIDNLFVSDIASAGVPEPSTLAAGMVAGLAAGVAALRRLVRG